MSIARAASALLWIGTISCGDAFSGGEPPDGGQAGQGEPDDAAPQATTDAATSDRSASPPDTGSAINSNATIVCSDERCNPIQERCCMQNSASLNDFCVGGPGQPGECKSDQTTVTLLECDDGEDCARAGKPGTICCAEARTADLDPNLVVWAAIRCVAPSKCLAVDDDVFCGSNGVDCPAGKACTKTLGPYTYCE